MATFKKIKTQVQAIKYICIKNDNFIRIKIIYKKLINLKKR